MLDKPRPVPTMGGGHAGWTFGEQSLTFMRTFKSGAMRVTFALARSADGLACTVSELLAREEGAGPIVLEPGAPGQQVTVVRSRQTGAECAVEKGTGTR